MTGVSAFEAARMEQARRRNGQFGHRHRLEPDLLMPNELPAGVSEHGSPGDGAVSTVEAGSHGGKTSVADEYVTQRTWDMPDGTQRRVVAATFVEAIHTGTEDALDRDTHNGLVNLTQAGLIDSNTAADGQVAYRISEAVEFWEGLLDDGDEHADHGEMHCTNRTFQVADPTWHTSVTAAEGEARKHAGRFNPDVYAPGTAGWPLYSCGHNQRRRGCGGCDPGA